MLGDTLDVPSTESTLSKEQSSGAHLRPLDTVEVILKLQIMVLLNF